MVSDEQFAAAIREVMKLNTGCYLGFGLDSVLIGQQEDGKYWVMETESDNLGDSKKVVWQKVSLELDEAIRYFLQKRKEREWGFDIEDDLNLSAKETVSGTALLRGLTPPGSL